MKRIVALTVSGAVAVGTAAIALAAATTAQAAPAAPAANNGNSSGTACVIHEAGGAWSGCLNVSVKGYVSAGKVNGRGTLDVDHMTSGNISKIQIDRVAVGTQNAGITQSRAVNSGTPIKPITAASSATDPYYQDCSKRYHVEVDYAVRLTSGQLKVGSYIGPWFDSSYGLCAGNNYQPATTSERCLVNGGACLELSVSAARSNLGTTFYARGTVDVLSGVNGRAGNDQISRVQVDSVVLGHQSAGVEIGPSMNSRDRIPLSAMSQTTHGFAWAHECATHYQAALSYSVRMKDGRLFTGHLATALFKAPGCL